MSVDTTVSNEQILFSIRSKIDEILSKRQKKAEELRAKREKVFELGKAFTDAKSLYDIASQIEDDEQSELCFEKIDALTPNGKDVQNFISEIDSVIKRFERDYVSIATVGKERQGKSRVLQSIGNLDNEVIPAYKSTSCTGAVSVIWNDSSMPEGAVKAVISFKDVEDFMSTVNTYVQIIDPSMKLGFGDLTKRGISDKLRRIVEKNAGNLDMSIAFNHLKDIFEHFEEEIRDLIGGDDIILNEKETIKTYVAQNDGKSESDGCEHYYKFIAVKRADIYCRFYNDIGKVRLVDTVGLEDTKAGIEEAMLETVKNECDAAIVVTKPISGIQLPDQHLYDLFRENFADRDTSKWLFYLSNKQVGVNDSTAEAFAKEINETGMAIANRSDDYQNMVVDASDPDGLYRTFIIPMLQKILENFGEINESYVRRLESDGDELIRKLEESVSESGPLSKKGLDNGMGQQAFLKGKQCFNTMSAELSRQVMYWGAERNNPNGELFNRVKVILDNIYEMIPSEEKLQLMFESNGALLTDDVWKIALNMVRNELTDKFIEIDEVLEEATRRFKNSLVKAIYEELKSLIPETVVLSQNEDELDMTQWLNEAIKIIDVKPEYRQIIKAFRFLCSFEFNTRAQIIQTVRQQLYIINPICDEYAKPVFNFHKNTVGKEVNYYLTSRISVVEENIRSSLLNLYRTPNQAFYAAAEEFYDRLTFASDMDENNTLIDMRDIWGMFFQDFYTIICAQAAQQSIAIEQFHSKYDELIQSIRTKMAEFPFKSQGVK